MRRSRVVARLCHIDDTLGGLQNNELPVTLIRSIPSRRSVVCSERLGATRLLRSGHEKGLDQKKRIIGNGKEPVATQL
ncbi:unnamed protein product [Boreogadus saida]